MRIRHFPKMHRRLARFRHAKRFFLFLAVWLVLSGAEGIVFGIAAAIGAAWMASWLAPPEERPLRLHKLLLLAPGFLRRSLVGGIDVAQRAFHPRLPLKPGWIAYPARLPRGTARVVLGGEISLMPGTLVAGVSKDRLLVHCLDTGMPLTRQLTEEEDRLAGAIEDG
jgi:multicomponent Na+:H+ antiporter subunit E